MISTQRSTWNFILLIVFPKISCFPKRFQLFFFFTNCKREAALYNTLKRQFHSWNAISVECLRWQLCPVGLSCWPFTFSYCHSSVFVMHYLPVASRYPSYQHLHTHNTILRECVCVCAEPYRYLNSLELGFNKQSVTAGGQQAEQSHGWRTFENVPEAPHCKIW